MDSIKMINKESPILREIGQLEAERTELLLKDYLSRAERQRLAEIRDELPVLWEKRRHEKDPYYMHRDYTISAEQEEDETFFRDNRRGPRLRTRLPKGDRDAA